MSTVDAGANVSGRGSAPVDDLASRREWMEHGTRLLLGAVDGLPDADLDAAIALEGWTRRHLVAHLAANADALGNLVRWAATGVETPMYASTTQRADDIEAGSTRPVGELRTWLSASAGDLDRGLDELTDEQWAARVRTAQGRTVPATEIPWMRAREVMVHAVDLGTGLTFADLPVDFLAALVVDVVGKRAGAGTGPALRVTITNASTDSTTGGEVHEIAGQGDPVAVTGSLADIAAWLTGRTGVIGTTDGAPGGAPGITRAGGGALPTLPPWL